MRRRVGRWWRELGLIVALVIAISATAIVVGSSAVAASSPPTVTVKAVSATEGAAFSGQVASFTDAAGKGPACFAASDYTVSVGWGDGSAADAPAATFLSGPDQSNLCTYSVLDSHTYAEEGHPKLSVSVTGPNSATPGQGSGVATVADAALHATSGPQHATAGTALSGTIASFTDADPGGVAGDYTATINWGDATTSHGTITSTGPGAAFDVTGSHTWGAGGSFTVTVTVKDAGGAQAVTSFTATVSSSSPGVTVIPVSAVEGASFSGPVASFTDLAGSGPTCSPASDYTVAIDWGDKTPSGTSLVGLVSGPQSGLCSYSVFASHGFAEEGKFTVTVSVSGPRTPGPGSGSGTATVTDAPLTASSVNQSATAGQPFSATVATLTDADPGGVSSDYSATISWGDGTDSTGTVSAGASGFFMVSGSHTWATAGSDTVTVTISDGGGSTATTSFTATVSAPPGHLTLTQPTASFLVADAVGSSGGLPVVRQGRTVVFNAAASQPSTGSHIVAYRWDFNDDGTYDAMTAAPTSRFTYYRAGDHSVTLQTEDSSGGFSLPTTMTARISPASDSGCTYEVTAELFDVGSGCIQDVEPDAAAAGGFTVATHHTPTGVYSIALDGGATLNGLQVSSPDPGTHLILDTRSGHWKLSSDGLVTFSISTNTVLGTIALATLDLQHNPVNLPAGGAATDPSSPGLRLLQFTAGANCNPAPQLVCATLPGGFPLTGSVGVFLTRPPAGTEAPGVTLTASLALHQPLTITGALTLTGNLAAGVEIDHFGFSTDAIDFGIGRIDHLSLTYDRLVGADMDVYDGQASAHLNTPTPIGISGEVRFANGSLQQVQFALTGTVPIGPIILHRLGGELGFNPFSIGGSLNAMVGPFGFGADVMYTDGHPWHFQVRNAIFSYLDVISVGAQFDLYEDGFISAGLTVRAAVPTLESSPPIVEIDGTIGGWMYGSQWQVSGGVRAQIQIGPVNINAGAQGFINSNDYAAGCGHISVFGFNVSGWGWINLQTGGSDKGLGGCDHIVSYCEAPPPGHDAFPCLPFGSSFAVRTASVGGPQKIRVKRGQQYLNLKLAAATGVPQVQITGPSGTFSPPSTGPGEARPYLSSIDPADHALYIFIVKPAAGVYTITSLPGSPAVGHLLTAPQLPDPQIHATIEGRGRVRKLVYSAGLDSGEKVRFVERGRDVGHVIATVTSGHGAIRFSAQDGRARPRYIEAEVQNNGLPQQPLTVAHFTAPAQTHAGRPGPIRFTRRADVVTLSWGRASSAEGYAVSVRVSDGRRNLLMTSEAKRRIVIRTVFPEMSIKVSVAAIGGPGLHRGRPRTGSLGPQRAKHTGKPKRRRR
jgi:hypothetical protein